MKQIMILLFSVALGWGQAILPMGGVTAVSGGGGATPAFVQGVGSACSGGVSSCATSAFGVNTTAGNDLICLMKWSASSITVTSVTDTAANTWSHDAGGTMANNATTFAAQVWYVQHGNGGADTVTVNWSGATVGGGIFCHEVSGLPTTGGFVTSLYNGSATNTVPDIGNMTATRSNQYVMAAYWPDGTLPTACAGFTRRVINGGITITEDGLSSGVGNIDPCTTAASQHWVAIGTIFDHS